MYKSRDALPDSSGDLEGNMQEEMRLKQQSQHSKLCTMVPRLYTYRAGIHRCSVVCNKGRFVGFNHPGQS